jgi:hypothetical protein
MMTAAREMMRVDVRSRRAVALTTAVLERLGPRIDATNPDDLPHDITRLVHDAMFEVMSEQGVEVLTDYDRKQLGLPPRGPDGWTVEEIMALEQSRLELLTQPFSAFLPIAFNAPAAIARK